MITISVDEMLMDSYQQLCQYHYETKWIWILGGEPSLKNLDTCGAIYFSINNLTSQPLLLL
jgi:hypothetical protein